MAHSRSSRKNLRKSRKHQIVNRMERSALRTRVKSVREAVAAGDKPAAAKAFVTAMSRIDKAAKRHVIHRNKAARMKSRLARRVNQTAAAPAPAAAAPAAPKA